MRTSDGPLLDMRSGQPPLTRYRVVYLTGASGTGKTALGDRLQRQAAPPVEVLSYRTILATVVAKRTRSGLVEHAEMRSRSGSLVRPEDVDVADEQLLDVVAQQRTESHVVVDSHAVTKEAYGFRITGFSPEHLRLLRPDAVVVLYLSGDRLQQRAQLMADGRPPMTQFDADLGTFLQASVAATYGILLGAAVYYLDATASVDELAATVERILEA